MLLVDDLKIHRAEASDGIYFSQIIPDTTGDWLTHCGLVTPYGAKIWVNIDSGYGLLPDGTKPLPEPKFTYHQ